MNRTAKFQRKLFRLMGITDLLKESIREARSAGITVEAIADEADLTPEAVYGYSGTSEGTFRRVIRLIVVLARMGFTLVLDRICADANGIFVPNADSDESPECNSLEGIAAVSTHTDAAIQRFVAAVRDRKYTASECEDLRRDIRRGQASLQRLDIIAQSYCSGEVAT